MADKKKLLLVDGNSVAFRAFYALYQSLNRFKNSSGLHTNAIYAFHNMLENIIEKEWNRKIVNNILLSKKENIFSRINKKRKYFLKNMFFINIKLREELLKK